MNTPLATGEFPRSSGILLHVTSLPGPHGIGDLGPAAFAWIDQLAAARQCWWQILPLGPTGYADSPYQCLSAFAGNSNLVSLERLVDDRLLSRADLPTTRLPEKTVDYDRVTPQKASTTALAYRRFKEDQAPHLTPLFQRFCRQEAEWLEAFALFVALKERHGGAPWYEWPAEHRTFSPALLDRATGDLASAVELHKFRQFLFFHQWHELRQYAHQNSVRLIGDMPIFISGDSADVWSNPELFQLDEQRRPTFVAGVPPDYFAPETGQLWGNPLYDWPRHAETGFVWWITRMRKTLELVDLVRLDHFRGFEANWAVPADSKTAAPGSWVKGPGSIFFMALKKALGGLPLIAEDLGVITPEVDALRLEYDLPGMRVLQFAFAGEQEDRFLPHNFDRHTVVYTGTHDNETTVGWFDNLQPKERNNLERYASGAGADPAWGLIHLAWASVADLAVAPLQDFLRLGNEARMNLPGTADGNWRWRFTADELTKETVARLAGLTKVYQRERKPAGEQVTTPNGGLPPERVSIPAGRATAT